MSSPSFTSASSSTTQHPEATSTQTSNNVNAAASQTTFQFDGLPEDPTQLSTGEMAEVTNKRWDPAPRRSVLKSNMEFLHPDLLEYYEDRSKGKIEAKSFEEWGEPVCPKEAVKLHKIEHRKVHHAFFEVNWAGHFTGRGVSPGAMERPGLIGPMNETIEEDPDSVGGLGHDHPDRPLWQAIDDKSLPSIKEMSKDEEDVGPFGESRDDIDVGPFGESRDDIDVGPFGESRDEMDVGPFGESRDDPDVGPLGEPRDEDEVGPFGESRGELNGLCQDHEDEEQQEIEEEVTGAEDMDKLRQLAATCVSMMSGALPSTEGASSPPIAATSSTQPSSLPFTSTPSTLSRKRARDSEEDAEDAQSQTQQKRRRMDDAFGIVRRSASRSNPNGTQEIIEKDADAAGVPQSAGAAIPLDIQKSRKRTRSSENDSEGSTNRSRPKRIRLLERAGEIRNDEEEHVADGRADASTVDGSTLAHHQPVSNNAAQDPVRVDANLTVHLQSSFPSQNEWNTAHGINCDGEKISVRKKGVYDVAGEWTNFYLPTYEGLPDRPWTEKERENLRIYIQDWNIVARSMNRIVENLYVEYFEVIVGRNRRAGRSERAGLPPAYPSLAPPPSPPDPDETKANPEPAPVPSEPSCIIH